MRERERGKREERGGERDRENDDNAKFMAVDLSRMSKTAIEALAADRTKAAGIR